MTLFDWLFNPSGLTPHGFCLSWVPGLVALHAGSDAVIGMAYFSIPLSLAWLVRGRPDLRFGWMIWAFGAFIIACGTTHFFSILTLWVPVYGLEGAVKFITAVLSVATAALLWPLVPKLRALPSSAQLVLLNDELAARIAEQEQTSILLRESEARVREINNDLECRVAERTADLNGLNEQLVDALAERASAERALARNEAEFRAGFEGGAVGKVLIETATGCVLRANRALAAMLGREQNELAGIPAADFTCLEDRGADAEEYAKLLSGETDTYVREKRYVRSDGSNFWVRVSATLARMPDGYPLLSVADVENIDERYRAEAELRAAKADLEAVVAERTAALNQRDLLLREVYHRVKNNLQIVDSLLLMQTVKIGNSDAKQALQAVRGRIYALGLVHQQLMGSNDLRTFDVEPFLHELSRNILEGSAEGDIKLSIDACPLVVGIDFGVPLGLLVTELVTNSMKHAFPHGRGKISVTLRPDEDGKLTLIVSDDGCGLGGSDRPQTSLGGTIVRELVAQLDAHMSVRDADGLTVAIRFANPVPS